MWMPKRPRESQIIDFLMNADQKPLNYATRSDLKKLGGATHFSRQIHLGTGEQVLARAHEVLTSWLMIPDQQIELFWPDRATRPGTSIAVGVSMYGGYWLNPCRVVDFTWEPIQEEKAMVSRISWKTIRGHCLAGSETFAVRMNHEGDVRYEISSWAAPMLWLRPFRSVIDRMRQRFQKDTCDHFARILKRYNQLRVCRKSDFSLQHSYHV